MKSLIKFTVDQFLDTGFHIGSIKYNTNTYSYLIGQRGNVFLFDLEQSLFLLRRALTFVESITKQRGYLLFVSITPSRSLQRFTYMLSTYCFQSSYAVSRWEGGVLSNWRKLSLARWRLFQNKDFMRVPLTKVKRRKLKQLFYLYMSLRKKGFSIPFKKNSVDVLESKKTKLKFPSAVFLYNPLNIPYPILEVSKVGMPLIGVVDSDNIYAHKYMYPIPGNDDSSIGYRFIVYLVAYSALRGIQSRRKQFWSQQRSLR
jgi:small subunit ribosomal protein S2